KTISTAFGVVAQPLRLEASFIAARILVNGIDTNEIAVSPTESISISIPWQNVLPVRIANAVIEATISGDISSDQVAGSSVFYDSGRKTVVFSQDTNARLSILEPGDTGELNFSIRPKQGGSLIGAATEPTLTISLNIQGLIDPGTFQQAQVIDEVA